MLGLKIIVYKKQHGSLPQSLNDLKVPLEVTIDNFTGKPFEIEKNGKVLKIKSTCIYRHKKLEVEF